MRKSVLALAIASLMFAGIALQATASAEPAVTTSVGYVSHASSFAAEANNTTTPGAGEFFVAIGGVIVFVAVLGFFLFMTMRGRKKKGIE